MKKLILTLVLILASVAGAAEQVALTTSAGLGGTVTAPDTNVYLCDANTLVTITATPSNGYRFISWTGTKNDYCRITGTLDPNIIGDYGPIGTYNNQPVYHYNHYYVFKNNTNWAIDGGPGENADVFWAHDTLLGDWEEGALGTGILTVSEISAIITDSSAISTTVFMDANCTITANFSLDHAYVYPWGSRK
jgi:hypothetical protein